MRSLANDPDLTARPTRRNRACDVESLAPAVTRAALILDVMAESGGEAVGPSELARRLGCPSRRSPTSAARWPTPGSSGGSGRASPSVGGWPSSAVRISPPSTRSRSSTRRVAQLEAGSEETVQFAVLDGLEMTYLARHDGRQPVRLTSGIGRRLPASCTATGKAALASLDDAELARRFAGVTSLPTLSARSHRNVEELMADLREVRRRGYAIDDEETMEGVVCYGVMVESRQPGEGPYAASITLVKVRATHERVSTLLADLNRLAQKLADPLRGDEDRTGGRAAR